MQTSMKVISRDDPEIPLCELISKNTIFAILCDDESYDYYLVKALTESYELDIRETDSWGHYI
jgi:hypothetical protein